MPVKNHYCDWCEDEIPPERADSNFCTDDCEHDYNILAKEED